MADNIITKEMLDKLLELGKIGQEEYKKLSRLQAIMMAEKKPTEFIYDELQAIKDKFSDIVENTKGIKEVDLKKIKGAKGEQGEKGDRGEKGDTGATGKQGPAGKDGKTPKAGVDFPLPKNGLDGKDGKDGKSIVGDKGDKPDHKWEGTKLMFEKPNGKWGKAIDLKGKDGKSSSSIFGGGLFSVAHDSTLSGDGTLNNPLSVQSAGASTFTSLTDVPSSYVGQGTKFVRVNGAETALEFATVSGGGDALTSAPLSQFAATTSLQLKGVISDETGSGALVFADTPTLVTPVLGAATGTSLQLSGLTASQLLSTDASKNLTSLDTATYPSLTEIAYVKGVTSAIQTQINTKSPSTSPTFATSITGSYLTASEMLITDGSKNIVSAPVATYPSLTELTYLKGVTSAIQTQINAKGAGTVTSVSVVTANGLSGSVATATTTPAITLDITALDATKIADGSVTSTEFQYINSLSSNAQTQLDNKQPLDADLTTIAGLTATTDNFLQAKSSAWASRTPTQVTADLIVMVGDSGSGGSKGLVPAPATGDATKFLRGDATWVTISGGGDALTSNPLSQFAATTSSQLAGVISDETGSGALVFATSPTFVTPVLGAATATSINKVAITAPATSATLTIANGKTLTASNTIIFTATDGSTLAIGAGGTLGSAAYTASSAYEVPLTFSTGLTRSTNTITVNTTQNIAKLSNLTSNGFVKTSGGDGTLSVDTNTYLTSLTGAVLTDQTVGQTIGATGARLTKLWATDIESTNAPTVSGAAVYYAGGTDVALADGGTGASLSDPNADRIMFWDDSAGAVTWLTAGTGLTITDTTITASGSGTVTNTGGNLTANAVVLGAGTVDVKVVAGITTDGTSVLNLGVNATTIGKVKMFGNTSGDVTIQPTAAAGTATVQTLPATTGTLVNRVTTANGVSASNSDGALSFTLGAITPTTVNGLTITTSTGTLTIANSKTATINNSITFSGTDSTTMTFPSTSATLARTDAANTFTGASTASAWVLTSPTITTKISPTTDDGAPLGDTTHNWSDLFLASGAVINIANSNWVATHTSGILTVGTGDLRVTTAGTNSASVVTVGGTQTLANKTLTSPVLNGTASGTALSSTATASTLAFRNSSANLLANNFASAYTSTATTGGTKTLVVGDACMMAFTGTSTHDINLPVTSTLTVGHRYKIVNKSTIAVRVFSSGGNTMAMVGPQQTLVFTCISTSGTSGTSWHFDAGFRWYELANGTNANQITVGNYGSGIAGALGNVGTSGRDFLISAPASSGSLILNTNATDRLTILSTGQAGFGQSTPTATIHLKAGTTSASSAPLKFTSGSLNTTAEAGAVEFLTDAFYGTITTGAARKTFAFLESPAFTTPNLGTPSAGTLTNCTGLPVAGITASTSTALGVGSVELGHATDTTISRSAAGVIAVEGVVIPSISSTNTLTNKRITKRTGTTTSSATPTINTDNVDFYSLTAQTADITSFTTNLSGTPTEGQTLWIAITGTAARAITWGSSFEASTIALPTTTVTTNRLDVGFIWNSATSKFRCIASA